MVKEVRNIEKYYSGEVAPALFITPHKGSHRYPRLEPIVEETSDKGLQIIMPTKRMLFLVPAFLSFLSFCLLYSSLH
ncbi:hypothetical protein Fmac_004693 [Flemingia macrophylla]|uniref:Uncharacterized protein n=1 Tax=Flemingia macrophylla TaxID=520843 RepID=A0ABD1N5M3_9FABA